MTRDFFTSWTDDMDDSDQQLQRKQRYMEESFNTQRARWMHVRCSICGQLAVPQTTLFDDNNQPAYDILYMHIGSNNELVCGTCYGTHKEE